MTEVWVVLEQFVTDTSVAAVFSSHELAMAYVEARAFSWHESVDLGRYAITSSAGYQSLRVAGPFPFDPPAL